MQRTFQHWIATKWLELDQDNLRMKFSALNVDKCIKHQFIHLLTATFKDLHIENSKNYKRWYCPHHTDCVPPCTGRVQELLQNNWFVDDLERFITLGSYVGDPCCQTPWLWLRLSAARLESIVHSVTSHIAYWLVRIANGSLSKTPTKCI